jgi:thioredoxin reductase (NADPH)
MHVHMRMHLHVGNTNTHARTEKKPWLAPGSGPAGLSAAIYAARAGLQPVVAAPAIGGQLQGKGVDVENFPGVNMSTGPNLVYAMQMQAASFGTVFEQDMVTSIDLSSRPFTIQTNDTTIMAHALIVATGADSRWLGVPGEWEHRGGGVSSCATCDGFLYSDKNVVVIGGGDAAMEDALVLARTSASVTVLHRRDAFRASKVCFTAHPLFVCLFVLFYVCLLPLHLVICLLTLASSRMFT